MPTNGPNLHIRGYGQNIAWLLQEFSIVLSTAWTTDKINTLIVCHAIHRAPVSITEDLESLGGPYFYFPA
jgi:hypothetical protein